MQNRDDASHSGGEQPENILHFSLPGLLPADHILAIEPSTYIASLLTYREGAGPRQSSLCQFSPGGMRVLIALLEAFPDFCPHDVLLASLYNIPLEASQKLLLESRQEVMKPLRRAISSIRDGLQKFGMTVYPVRGEGYEIKPL
jgi:DNA-binding winged helix-turn-helix (wHTH) protein